MKYPRSLVLALATTVAPLPVMADALQPVTITVGTTVLNVGYPMLTLPLTLGYFADEGYDVRLEPVGASLQALQQLIANNADFAQVNSSVIIQANTENELPVRVAMGNGVIDWSISVPTDSDIHTATDLNGKTIGVFSLATGGIALMNSYLSSEGMDPQRDIELIPLGLGAAPVQALRNGQVDALLYWASATAGFENAGLDLRQIVADDWRTYPDFSIATMAGTAETDPDKVVAIARSIAKGTIFALENPECAVRMHWAEYPETKPTGADEDTLLQWDLNYINAQLASLSEGFALHGGEQWGSINVDAYDRLQKFLQETGVISRIIDAMDYPVSIENFAERVSDFDADEIRSAARACEMPS